MIKIVLAASRLAEHPRTQKDVLMCLTEEVGELATEIAIVDGFKDREPSEDGIVGEAVDVILAALDIIALTRPEITEKELKKRSVRYRAGDVVGKNGVEKRYEGGKTMESGDRSWRLRLHRRRIFSACCFSCY